MVSRCRLCGALLGKWLVPCVCPGVALMPPPGSVVLFLTRNVGEDVPTLPPDVVSRQL